MLAFLHLGSLVACGGESTATREPLVVGSDPALVQAASALVPELVERSGLELRSPVRIERRSREQLVAYLTAKLDEELPADRASRLVRSYAQLGMVPADLDLRALLLEVYTEQVAGFYDPDSVALFVLEDQPAASLQSVLLHELVHAVQDQHVDLDSLASPDRGNDAQTAAQAAIEGHATLVMLEFVMGRMQGGETVDLSRLEGFGAELRSALGTVRDQFPALARAPRVIQESLLFPYLEGAAFVQRVWASGERPAPFGAYLPLSTEQVLHPDRLLDVRDDPWHVELRAQGGTVVHEDELGALETRLFFEELAEESWGAEALGWRGDRYQLLEAATGDALVWVSVWDDEAARARFSDRIIPFLDRLPAAARLETVELDGQPGLVLHVGETGEVAVTVRAPAAEGAGAP